MHTGRRLKTQHGFVQGVLEIKEQLDIDFVPEPLLSSLDPTIDKGFRIRTELTQAVSKQEQITSILRSLALETIGTMYSEPDWVHIYTDGSLLKDSNSTGAGVYCHLFFFLFTTTFDGEVAPFKQPLRSCIVMSSDSFTRAVVFCDSKAAIFAVNSNSTHTSSNTLDCKKTCCRICPSNLRKSSCSGSLDSTV
ncbi:hypothetical protein TNCT_90771 [Trichonephila clavata]|uniref:Uncharacterized protein n=1 Tax=Trichonephila clavata TaxID=2740835 RepID=A0A8X6H1C0_TRICU|nr:hypothetical protein TNCT_90771 [Trichonephila clavata]